MMRMAFLIFVKELELEWLDYDTVSDVVEMLVRFVNFSSVDSLILMVIFDFHATKNKH